jgi:uncharacterized protein YcfJ
MQRFLTLTGFIILGWFGLSEPPRVPRADAIHVSTAAVDSGLGSPVIPAVLYSESNTNELWSSGTLVKVVARRRRYRRRVVVRRRKFSHSAAIVGGSAAGGAAIGALAGGGKGAAIGALAGGGAGYIYDRKTSKKRMVVRE